MSQSSRSSKIKFEPFDLFNKRLVLSKEESDSAYFMELLLKGEFLCKVITSTIVSSVMDDYGNRIKNYAAKTLSK